MPVETVDRLAQELNAEAEAVRADVDQYFQNLLASPGDSRDRLYEVMRHAAIGGGKRLRPLLTVAASRLFATDRMRALRVGSMQLERVMQGAHGAVDVSAQDVAGDLDRRRRNDLRLDALVVQHCEHLRRDSRMAFHAGADEADLAQVVA